MLSPEQLEHHLSFKAEKEEIPFSCCVFCGDQEINIFSKTPNIYEYFGGIYENPLLIQQKVSLFPSRLAKYSMIVSGGEEYQIKLDPQRKILSVVGDRKLWPELPHICYCLSEIPRQEEGRATIHAAAVSNGERGILILGNKGAGKTSLALTLCQEYGMRLIGNDLVIVGAEKLFGGTKTITLRLAAADRNFPELRSQFKERLILTKGSRLDRKITFIPNEIGIQIESQPVELTTVISVFIDTDPEQKLMVAKPNLLQMSLILWENLSRYIRTTTTPIMDENINLLAYFPSLDREDLYQARTRIADFILRKIGIISVSGGCLQEIAQKTVELHEKGLW